MQALTPGTRIRTSLAFMDLRSKLTKISGSCILEPIVVGQLPIPSGKLLAGDPGLLFSSSAPFARTVTPGNYEVIASLALPRVSWWRRLRASPMERGMAFSPRVAFLSLIFDCRPACRFELAGMYGKEPDRSGLAVDVAMAGFVDAEAASRLQDNGSNLDLIEPTSAAFKQRDDTLQLAAVYQFDVPPMTIAACSSGWGDGYYYCYWGLADNGQAVQLIIDFKLDRDED